MPPLGLGGEDAGVGLRFSKFVSGQVLRVHGCPLLFVVGTSVANNNLRRVLVWHNNGWLRQTVSEAERVVRL